MGGLRSSSQMISYEIPLGLSIISVVMLAGSLRLQDIVHDQAHLWNFIRQPLAFIIFVVSAFAETNRLPFDLPEAEQELVGGYHTEYSSMKFASFMLSEYANMITSSALVVTLFLGGWQVPFGILNILNLPLIWEQVIQILSFVIKTGFMIFVFIWVRWTLPRFRFDQLMNLGWKSLLPLALVEYYPDRPRFSHFFIKEKNKDSAIMIQMILFFIFAFLAVAGGVMVISHRNPIYSALFLILTLFSLAGIYILLLAHFIAIVHIAVYAGAIMVLFLFVIMLLNLKTETRAKGAFKYMIYLAVPMAIILCLELGIIGFHQYREALSKPGDIGTVESIGTALFSTYLLPFEITSVLLIVAMAGALFLSKKKLLVSKE